MTKKKKKNLEDIYFPIPKNFLLKANSEVSFESNEVIKKNLFQQTIKTAYQIHAPSSFISSHCEKKPESLVSEEQVEIISSLFSAIQPQDAVEAALAQQFIITHLQTITSSKHGMGPQDIKKLELSHQILETIRRYKSIRAQQINVQ